MARVAATRRTKARPRTCAMVPRTQHRPGPFRHHEGRCRVTLTLGRRYPVLPRTQCTVLSLLLQSLLLPLVDLFHAHLLQTMIPGDTPPLARCTGPKVHRMHCHSPATTSRSALALATATPPAPQPASLAGATRTGPVLYAPAPRDKNSGARPMSLNDHWPPSRSSPSPQTATRRRITV